MMKRRDALKTLGGLGAAAGMARVLPGCGSGGSGITTYVFMMMENRSYDHLLGARSMLEGMPGDGLTMTMTNPDQSGAPIAPWEPDVLHMCDTDPPHGWERAHLQWNHGANDGFVIQHQLEHGDPTAIEPMQYLTRKQVPVTWALADRYAIADRWFCSVMGPTFPNRFYWHTGTSGGLNSNVVPAGGLSWGSIYHRLEAKGIDWRYYYSSLPVVSAINGVNLDKVRYFTEFLDDAAAGTLPPVVYIDPAFNSNDDHPPVHPINGQELITTVYRALATSPQWKNCLLLITYDENGGFFDHVPPPTTVDDHADLGFDQMGFRVPALVAGPYVKQGHVSSVVYDHCSALREIELAFGLDPLNQRTAAAHDLGDFIDADRLSRGEWAPPIDLPVIDLAQWPMGKECMAGSLAAGSHPVLEWADAHPERVAGLDRRAELPEYRRAIRDFLARRPRVPVR
ncbi:MAG TPA: alkaline phosphatase family protein [Kofleriaceae bacterium]|nr:alkaline phosphatase family protein [Kofleriaceae bacterium]